MAMGLSSIAQQEVCSKFRASYLSTDGHLKVGISRNFDPQTFPINGLRHPPEGDTSGWYIWSGEKYSADPDFFVPLHARHLNDRCPEILKYLGLGPGWRFLTATDHEAVWYDAGLLDI